MVQITYTSQVKRGTKVVSEDSTIKEVLGEIGFSFDRGVTSLNGGTITNEDLDKTLKDFGVSDSDTAYITNVAKAANA